MKTTLILSLVLSSFTGLTFAQEVSTDCPYMAESTQRLNTKAIKDTSDGKKDSKVKTGTSKQ